MSALMVYRWTGLTGREYSGTALAVARSEEAARLAVLHSDEITTNEDLQVVMGPPFTVTPADGWATVEWSE